MKIKRLLLLTFIVSLITTSCNNSDVELKNGGTFKVTASSGTSKTMDYTETDYKAGVFLVNFNPYSPNINANNRIGFLGLAIGGGMSILFDFSNPIQIGKDYTYTHSAVQTVTSTYIEFSDWIDSDYSNTTKSTINFSRFQYPGRITGVIINYDKIGKILIKGEFDFVCTKPKI